MEMERTDSRGIASTGLGFGIAGTALGLMQNGGFGGILGGCGNNGCAPMVAMERELSHKDGEIAMLRADRDTDKKVLELYQYVDGRMRSIEGQLAQQAVVNAQITANLSCMQRNLDVLNGLTKTVIPVASICPEVMPRYNSYVAPTTEAATGA